MITVTTAVNWSPKACKMHILGHKISKVLRPAISRSSVCTSVGTTHRNPFPDMSAIRRFVSSRLSRVFDSPVSTSVKIYPPTFSYSLQCHWRGCIAKQLWVGNAYAFYRFLKCISTVYIYNIAALLYRSTSISKNSRNFGYFMTSMLVLTFYAARAGTGQ